MNCHVCDSLNSSDTVIFETDHWKCWLADKQTYLGRAGLTLKRHAASLTDLTDAELLDFMVAAKKYETVCKKLFDATLFNYGILVNNSYRKKPYNPHAHWHIRPRYDHEVVFEGTIFKDPNFGEHYDINLEELKANDIDSILLGRLVAAFRKESK